LSIPAFSIAHSLYHCALISPLKIVFLMIAPCIAGQQKITSSPMKNAWKPFLESLDAITAFDATEAAHIATTRNFVERAESEFFARSTLEGHVTGSAFVINRTRSATLLLHHAKLDRWVQPGGHIDETDASPAHAALREAREETGIVQFSLASTALFDVDVHPIPERNKGGVHEPAHFHFDARYLVVADQEAVALSEESLGFRWVALDELAAGPHESGLVRMAKKVIHSR
jgi:8-oxo-dGTP pyrophosphatase MutT (NUDIX family)